MLAVLYVSTPSVRLQMRLDPDRYDVELVHLGEQKDRIADAEAAGVKSVPALVINGAPFHINFGAPMSALKS